MTTIKELVYDADHDILLKRENDVTLFVYTLINSGYTKHHTSLRCGSVPKGVSFVRQYSGRFGVGVIIVSFHRRGCVEATYYIKEDS